MEQDRKKTPERCSPGVHDPAMRLAMKHRDDYRRDAAWVTAVARKPGCAPDSLRDWVRQAQRDGGERPAPTSAEQARIKELERENRELRQADETLKTASAYFARDRKQRGIASRDA